MRYCRLFALILAGIMAVSSARAGDSSFQKYNPDVDKYPFVRDFILSVGYFKRVSERQAAEGVLKEQEGDSLVLIRKCIEDRTLDNTEIRIARNYLARFSNSSNGLIRKVARQAVAAYDGVLGLSVKERDLWQVLLRYKTSAKGKDIDEVEFAAQQESVAVAKKEAMKQLLEAAQLLQVVLLSAERCETQHCKELALTREERLQLTGNLDKFAKNNLQWGLKPGQSTQEGVEASIREVLEDPLYISK